MIRGLRRANSVCAFAFRSHWTSLNNDDSGKEVLFTCQRRCIFKGCKVTFTSHIDKSLQLHIKFKGTVRHAKMEKACRYIRESDREAMKKVLKHKLPQLHYLEQMKKLDFEALASGCRDGCPSKDVLKQIPCESRRIETPDENIWLALHKIKTDQHQASPSSATLQVIMMEPPTLMFCSMESIRVLRSICKEDVMYIDATGSVPLGQSHCYVYEVVVRNPMERNPPLVVASMITWAHDIPSIDHCLQRVRHAQSKHGSSRFYPRLVMCDGSMALINAIVSGVFKRRRARHLPRTPLLGATLEVLRA